MLKGSKRHGEGTMEYLYPCDKQKTYDVGTYTGHWKHDRRDGRGVMKYSNGSSFEGLWKNDQPYNGIFKYINGEVYNGALKNSKPNGLGSLKMSDRTIEGYFINGHLSKNKQNRYSKI